VPTGADYRSEHIADDDDELGLGLVYPVFEEYMFHSPENSAVSMRLVYDLLLALQNDLRAAKCKHEFVSVSIRVPNRLSLEQELMNAGYEIRGDEAVLLGTELLKAPPDKLGTRLRRWRVERDAERVTLLPQATPEDYRWLVFKALDAVAEVEEATAGATGARMAVDDDAPLAQIEMPAPHGRQLPQVFTEAQGLVRIFSRLELLPVLESDSADLMHVRVCVTNPEKPRAISASVYVDGSQSMRASGYFGDSGRTLFSKVFGQIPNAIDPVLRELVPALTPWTVRNVVPVARFSAGSDGMKVDLLGAWDANDAEKMVLDAPAQPGLVSRLLPMMEHFVRAVNKHKLRDLVCAFVLTNGRVVDVPAAFDFSSRIAAQVARRQLPRVHFILGGINGDLRQNSLARLEEIFSYDKSGVARNLWHFVNVKKMAHLPRQLLRVFANLQDDIPGDLVILDEHGRKIKSYASAIPAVFSFDLPRNTNKFWVEFNKERFAQDLS
jgi:hypothetical protein